MDLQLLNDILSAFTQAFDAAAVVLVGVGLTLLAVIAAIAWYTSYRTMVFSSGAGLGEVMASCILFMVTVGVTGWIVLDLQTMTNAVYQTFLFWGSGGALGPDALLNPAAIVNQGFQQAKPIRTFTDNLVSWLKMWDWDTLMIYSISFYMIIIGFFFIALTLIMVVIEFKLAVMLGAVLIPLAVWHTSSFLAEAAIGWIVGGAVRVFVLAALYGAGSPLFARITPLLSTTDPDFKSAVACGFVSLLFAILTWVVPRRAASLVGTGLGLAGQDAIAGAMSGLRAAQVVVGGVRRAMSHMVEATRS